MDVGKAESFCTPIDAVEFERAKCDPKVRALLEAADRYAQMLVNAGACPRCLVTNCDCANK